MRTCVNLSKLSIIEALHNKSFLTKYVGISLEMHFEYLNVSIVKNRESYGEFITFKA